MPNTAPCPTVDELKRFQLGDLPEAAGEAVQRHLANCRTCLASLQRLHPTDTLIESLREQKSFTIAEDDEVRGMISRMLEHPSRSKARTRGSSSSLSIDLTQLLAPPKQADEIGRLGPYRVFKVLGAGGMGMVLLGEDSALRRRVALKVIRPELVAEATSRQRFLREARAMAAVKSDHVVVVHRVGEDRGVPFMAMEFLEGETLEARLRRARRLSAAEICRVGREVAEGLAAAHARGLIHRDIKPSNLWLERGTDRVKILDFGLAWLNDNKPLTEDGYILGTPAYMSPEQAQSNPIDARSDLFSLGSVLYNAAAGEPPFEEPGTWGTFDAVVNKEPRPLREINPEIPKSLVALITQLLAKRPQDRPPSAQAVAEALRALTPAPARFSRRQKWAVTMVAAGLLLAALVGGPLRWLLPGRDGSRSAGPPHSGNEGKAGPAALPPIEKPLPDRAKPFVAVPADGKGRKEFASFKPALDALEKGAVLEVHGNGPFVLGQVALPKGTGLKLRAAPGYRPRFQLESLEASPAYWFQVREGPLVIEGCDFLVHAYTFARGDGEDWQVSNCRLLMPESGQIFRFDGRRFRLHDCLIDGPGQVILAGPRAQMEIVNNLIRSHRLLGLVAPAGQSVRLEANTLLLNQILDLPGAKDAEAVSLVATGNLFHLPNGVMIAGWADAWNGRFRWTGEGNLYSGRDAVRVIEGSVGKAIATGLKDKEIVKGMEAWKQFWGGETTSQETVDVLFGWDQTRLATPEDMVRALRPTTEWAARWAGKDALGPSWEMVGAGEAYLKALKEDQKRPEALGLPFALVRPGKPPAGYATLTEALSKAVSGDTIEVRGDGPFAGSLVSSGGRTLTLRALPGFRPVLEGGLVSGDIWTIEGIHFRKGGVGVPLRGSLPLPTVARLANCSFEGPLPGTTDVVAATFAASSGKPAEVVNCLVPAGLRARLAPGGTLIVQNSVVGQLFMELSAGAVRRLELRGCVFHNLNGAASLLSVAGEAKLAVTAQRTLFEGLVHTLVADRSRWLAGWEGEGNVYRFGGKAWTMSLGTPRAGLADWQRLWKDTEKGSAEAPPLGYEAFEWRLHPSSPGYRAGPGGKDLGADGARIARTTTTTK